MWSSFEVTCAELTADYRQQKYSPGNLMIHRPIIYLVEIFAGITETESVECEASSNGDYWSKSNTAY